MWPLLNLFLFKSGREKVSTQRLTPQIPATARVGLSHIRVRSGNSILVSRVVIRNPSTRVITCCFPGCTSSGNWPQEEWSWTQASGPQQPLNHWTKPPASQLGPCYVETVKTGLTIDWIQMPGQSLHMGHFIGRKKGRSEG